MSLARVWMVAGALAVLLQAGCAEKPTRPAVTDVDFSLAVSPVEASPSQPVVADVRVRNVGTARVWHDGGCGCSGFGLSVIGPKEDYVLLRDPNQPWPGCPCWNEPMDPGQDFVGGLAFNGTLYAAGSSGFPSPTYPAPEGTYTVVARFSYRTSALGESFTVERRTTFTWTP